MPQSQGDDAKRSLIRFSGMPFSVLKHEAYYTVDLFACGAVLPGRSDALDDVECYGRLGESRGECNEFATIDFYIRESDQPLIEAAVMPAQAVPLVRSE